MSINIKEEIQRLVTEASANLTKAEQLADEHGLTFEFEHPHERWGETFFIFSDSYKGKALVQEEDQKYYNLKDKHSLECFNSISGEWQSSDAYC